jgi:hypothetical protein
MNTPEFTYGDLLGVGYLLGEFHALDFCLKYNLSPSMIALLEQAQVRKTRHQFLSRKRPPQVRPVTIRLSERDIAEAVAETMSEVANELRGELTERLANLESKVAVMQAHELKWIGTWHKALRVPLHGMVTHAGSLWLKVSETDDGRPGDGSAVTS